ncbi:MAG: HPr(Ser) kinase/phosphatase, partial [Eubacterium sp.]|nr:HPr(Ser) kinase/phosphatase [Eubacterium sp.]
MKEKIVTLTNLMEQMKLKYVTPEIDLEGRSITIPEINRPALQLTGYFEHFMNRRVQIIGYVEYTYLMQKTVEERVAAYEAFISKDVPCVVFTTQTDPGEELLELARKYEVPTFVTDRQTSPFTAEITRWLNVQLAPSISIHGVLI